MACIICCSVGTRESSNGKTNGQTDRSAQEESYGLKLVGIAPLKSSSIDSSTPSTASVSTAKTTSLGVMNLQKYDSRLSPSRVSPEKSVSNPVSAQNSPVIITQPIRTSSSLTNRLNESNATNITDKLPLNNMPRHRETFLQADLLSSAEHWRRALSPAPELFPAAKEYGDVKRSASPSVEMILARQHRSESSTQRIFEGRTPTGSNITMTSLEQSSKRLDVKVINPVRVPPLVGMLDHSTVGQPAHK